MNLLFNMLLAVNKTYLITGCALIGVAAVLGIIICCVQISHHKKKANEKKTAAEAEKPVLPAETAEEVAEQPIETTVTEQAVEEVEEPAEEEPEAEQAVEEVEEPAEEEPEAEQAVEEVEEPAEEQPEAEQAVEEAEEPTEEEPEAEQVVEEAEEPAEEEPEAEQVVEEVEEPAEEEPEVEQVVEEVEEPAEEEPETEQVVEEAEEPAEEESEAEELYDTDEPDEADDADENTEEEAAPQQPVIPAAPPEGKIFIRVRYNRSYTARIIQSEDLLKDYYTQLKNELMRYKVSNRTSWKHETFRSGRKLLVKLAVRGKTLYVYYALNPEDYADSKYKIKDVSSIASKAATPVLYKIKNDRRLKYAKELIATVMAENGLEAGEELHEDYAAQYPYEELEPLIERKLVKLLPWKEFVPDSEEGIIAVSKDNIPPELLVGNVTVTEAEDMFVGENVDALVTESERVSDRTKKTIINIDTLGKYFESGEKVTLEEIKKRIPDTLKKATYLKVLARGTLDKPLTIEADDFSPAAIKMIVITGGTAVRTKQRT